MADLKKSRKENIAGPFFVDSTCIDCDTCRWLAPAVFREEGDQSAVYHQPQSEEEAFLAAQAVVACPTASIGAADKSLVAKASTSFPDLIDGNVYYSGYASEKSFGAASYFIQRKAGNVLVDSPRFAAPLVKRLEEMGGVKYLYLTHRDDVADHEQFQKHFGCERILHEEDVLRDTRNVEIQLKGSEVFDLAPDLKIIPVPGHTKGHTVLLYQNKYLFTGDHLAWSDTRKQLVAFRGACWYSWEELKKSMIRLKDYDFEWVLPGHGRRLHGLKNEMRAELAKCLLFMENEE